MINVICSKCGVTDHASENQVGLNIRCGRCASLVPIVTFEAPLGTVIPPSLPMGAQLGRWKVSAPGQLAKWIAKEKSHMFGAAALVVACVIILIALSTSGSTATPNSLATSRNASLAAHFDPCESSNSDAWSTLPNGHLFSKSLKRNGLGKLTLLALLGDHAD